MTALKDRLRRTTPGPVRERSTTVLDQWLARHRRVACVVDVGRHMARDAEDDRVPGLAAEVAFFALLSVFPGLLGVAAGLGALDRLFGSELARQAQHEVVAVLETFLTDRAGGPVEAIEALFEGGSAGVFTFGVLAALWAASRGMATVLRTLAEIYEAEEIRSRLRRRMVAVGLAAASMLLVTLTLAAVVLGPLFGAGRVVAGWVGVDVAYRTLWGWLGMPLAFLALLAWAAVVFHSVPHRHVGWRHHIAGAALTGLLWLLVSFGFRLYLQLFGGNPVFGVLGGALVVLLWLYMLSLALLIGAELNAVLAERSATAVTERPTRPEPSAHRPAPGSAPTGTTGSDDGKARMSPAWSCDSWPGSLCSPGLTSENPSGAGPAALSALTRGPCSPGFGP